MDIKEKQRASNYKLLAECYYSPDGSLQSRLENVDDFLDVRSRLIQDIPDEKRIETLQIDYAKLFVGPYKVLAPPYGSYYLENHVLMGESTVHATTMYQDEGLDMTLMEYPDHIKVELEFMFYLIERVIDASQSSGDDNAEYFRGKQREFFKNHIGRWVFAFCDLVQTHAMTKFYINLAKETRFFIEQEKELLFDHSF